MNAGEWSRKILLQRTSNFTMLVRIVKTYRDVVVVCDTDLLGKKFEEGNFQLDIKESFYKGKETDESEVIEILQDMVREDATFNIVGKESTNAAIKSGIISEDNIQTIQNIPFAIKLL